MLTYFFRHRHYMIAIFALLFASILCQLLIGLFYHRLIRETENMSATKNKSLQKLKLKFSNCRQLRESLPNVPVFVDKHLHQLSIGRIPVSLIRHLSGQLTLLSVFVAGIGACAGIIGGENILMISPFYLVSFLGLYLHFAVTSLMDIPGKANILRTNLVDYLENHLAGRLDQTRLDMRLVEPGGNAASEAANAGLKPQNAKADAGNAPEMESASSCKKSTPVLTPAEAEELELLLREFV